MKNFLFAFLFLIMFHTGFTQVEYRDHSPYCSCLVGRSMDDPLVKYTLAKEAFLPTKENPNIWEPNESNKIYVDQIVFEQNQIVELTCGKQYNAVQRSELKEWSFLIPYSLKQAYKDDKSVFPKPDKKIEQLHAKFETRDCQGNQVEIDILYELFWQDKKHYEEGFKVSLLSPAAEPKDCIALPNDYDQVLEAYIGKKNEIFEKNWLSRKRALYEDLSEENEAWGYGDFYDGEQFSDPEEYLRREDDHYQVKGITSHIGKGVGNRYVLIWPKGTPLRMAPEWYGFGQQEYQTPIPDSLFRDFGDYEGLDFRVGSDLPRPKLNVVFDYDIEKYGKPIFYRWKAPYAKSKVHQFKLSEMGNFNEERRAKEQEGYNKWKAETAQREKASEQVSWRSRHSIEPEAIEKELFAGLLEKGAKMVRRADVRTNAQGKVLAGKMKLFEGSQYGVFILETSDSYGSYRVDIWDPRSEKHEAQMSTAAEVMGGKVKAYEFTAKKDHREVEIYLDGTPDKLVRVYVFM